MGKRIECVANNFVPQEVEHPPLDVALNRRDMVEHFDSFLNQQRNSDGTVGQLTDYQTEVLEVGRDFIASADENVSPPNMRGRFDLACGFGKTAVELYMARGVGAGQIQHNGSRRQVLLNTSRLSIVKQMTEANIQYECDEGLTSDLAYFAPELHHSIYTGRRKDSSGAIVIMPYNSYKYAVGVGDVHPNTFPLCLLDESHNLGEKRSEALFDTAARAIIMGFSATPVNTRLTLPNQIAEVNMLDGIMRHRFLSNMRMYATTTGQIIRKSREDRHDYSSSDMSHLSHDHDRNKQIVDIITRSAQEYGRGIVRCHPEYKGFNHARQLLQMIQEQDLSISKDGVTRPLRVEIVYGKSKTRAEIMDEFRNTTNIDALLSVSYLAEGVNVPGIRWGLWAPPTRSYDLLEQFMGRGNRRDVTDPDKVFHFYQMADTDVGKIDGNVFGWELLGAPREALEINVTQQRGLQYQRSPLPPCQKVPTFDSGLIVERITKMAMSADMVQAPPVEEPVDLADLEASCGIEHIWLRRILCNAGYSAYIRPDDDDFVICYEGDARNFVVESIAAEEDMLSENARMLFDMDNSTFMKMLDDYGFDAPYLYPRQPGLGTRMLLKHIRAATYRALKDYEAMSERQEMPLYEAVELAGINPLGFNAAKYFDDRSFKIVKTRTLAYGRDLLLGERDALLEWAAEYRAAVQAPEEYRTLKGYCRQQFADGKPTYKDFFDAARNCGAEVKIFLNKAGARQDYVSRSVHKELYAAIERVLKEKKQQQPADESDVIRMAVPEAAERLAKQFSLPTEYVHALLAGRYTGKMTFQDMDDVRQELRQKRAAVSVVSDEPQLKTMLTGQQATQRAPAALPVKRSSSVNAGARASIHDRPFNDTPQELIDPLRQVASSYTQSPRLLKLFLRRHELLKNYHLETQADVAINRLTEILGVYGRALPSVPESWVYSGDLARQLHISHYQLIQLLVAKRINSDHAALIKMPGIPGIFAFCSSQLVAALLNNSSHANS